MKLGVALLMSMLAVLSGCISDPVIRIKSVQLLEAKTAVTDDSGNQLYARGYLLFNIESDKDLTKLVAENEAELSYNVETCESRINVDRWPYPYASREQGGNRVYKLLIAYRDKARIRYDLANKPEDLCIRVRLGSMNPFVRAESNELRFSLTQAVRQSLQDYARKGGVLELQLSPSCEAHMCIPEYGK